MNSLIGMNKKVCFYYENLTHRTSMQNLWQADSNDNNFL